MGSTFFFSFPAFTCNTLKVVYLIVCGLNSEIFHWLCVYWPPKEILRKYHHQIGTPSCIQVCQDRKRTFRTMIGDSEATIETFPSTIKKMTGFLRQNNSATETFPSTIKKWWVFCSGFTWYRYMCTHMYVHTNHTYMYIYIHVTSSSQGCDCEAVDTVFTCVQHMCTCL